MEGGVAPGTGVSFEFAEYLLAEALPLIVEMGTTIVISIEIYWRGNSSGGVAEAATMKP